MATEFTPFASLLGGGLIGLAAILLMATLGRIMGATGILAGALLPSSGEALSWRAAVLAGMVSGPLAVVALTGEMPQLQVPASVGMLVVGGGLVGVGVTLGSGCTSGHGVCGLARLSRRSIAATLTFMATTATTVYILRHLVGG